MQKNHSGCKPTNPVFAQLPEIEAGSLFILPSVQDSQRLSSGNLPMAGKGEAWRLSGNCGKPVTSTGPIFGCFSNSTAVLNYLRNMQWLLG